MKDYLNLSDNDLYHLFIKGDSHAFDEIYIRYNSLLYIFVLKKVDNHEDAQDIVHDVFSWLWEQGRRHIISVSLKSYLFKASLNKVLDYFRKKKVFDRYINLKDEFFNIDSNGTDFLIREKDIQQLITIEIEKMPPKMKEVFKLRTEFYLDNTQIGQNLGISEETVKTHVKHAYKRLRKNLIIRCLSNFFFKVL